MLGCLNMHKLDGDGNGEREPQITMHAGKYAYIPDTPGAAAAGGGPETMRIVWMCRVSDT